MNEEDVIFVEADKFKKYFEKDEENIDNIITKLNDMEKIIDEQVNQMKNNIVGRGTQKYMIDHITNAISIQSQIQSLLKDKRSIKENSLNLAIKNLKGQDIGDENSNIFDKLNEIIKNQKNTEVLKTKKDNEINVDEEIAKRLENS